MKTPSNLWRAAVVAGTIVASLASMTTPAMARPAIPAGNLAVSFVSNGGRFTHVLSGAPGDTLTVWQGPWLNKPGFSFSGWNCIVEGILGPNDVYTVSNVTDICTAIYVPNHVVHYAWPALNFQGRMPPQQKMAEGASLTLPDNPTKVKGYHFTGWSDGTSLYQPGDWYVVGAQDVTFTPVWVAN